MEGFLKDLKYSLRVFSNSPGVTIAAVAAVALGIGANTAIFSVVNAVLLKPVRAPEPARVVAFMNTSLGETNSYASEIKFNLWREQTSVFQDVSGYRLGAFTLTGVDQPQEVNAVQVTSDYFRLFGLPVARGRGFSAEDERISTGQLFESGHVAILSDAFWKRAFGGAPNAVGKTISLSGNPYDVIGIMAPGIQTELPEPDVWMAFPIGPNSTYQVHYFQALGLLKPGITIGQANAQLKLTTQAFRRKFPNSLSTSRGDEFSVQPLRDVLVKDVRPSLLILAGAVSFVLLIACANVANLLLARGAARTREIAIRVAMGASRGRIVQQLLTESVALSILGTAFGLALGTFGIHALLALVPANIPRMGEHGSNVSMDWRVLCFSILAALITGLLFGLIPALQASQTVLRFRPNALRQNRARSLLVIGEMSLALLLLIGSALLIRTLIALRSVNPGFDAHNVVTTRTSLDPSLVKASGVDPMVRDVFRRLAALPGVESAAFTRLLPLDGSFNSLPFIVSGRPLSGPSHGNSRWTIASAGFFDVLKIPVVRGRVFTERDGAGTPGVVVINQSMARIFWPGSDPLNDQILIGKGLGPSFEEPARQVIGVVSDIRDQSLDHDAEPEVYVPAAQVSDARMVNGSVAWVIRTHAAAPSLDSSIQAELRQATGQPVAAVRSMEEIMVQSTARQDFNMLLMSIFGGSALLLAAIGIYGLLSYSVQQRTRELGIRLALGAKSSGVRNMVVLQGMRLALTGVGIGIVAAFGLTRFIASFLFGVKAWDPVAFTLTPLLLSAVAFIAVWVPARRASRVDPMRSLRHE
jgi:putative ABC transport system permease protein